MISNRSVPADSVLPHVEYRDVREAIDWLNKTFGFVEHYHYGEPGGPISGAQVHLGGAVIMLKRRATVSSSPKELGYGTQMLTVFVDDIHKHFKNAQAAGAVIFEELCETVYGERQYGAEDPDGHRWLFSQHARDLHPAEWGAVVSQEVSRVTLLRRPRFCYLELPSVDPQLSAKFYEEVFDWNIRHRDSDRPSFDDATGHVSGAFVSGRAAADKPGLVPYIWVDDMEATLAKVRQHGGVVLEGQHADSPEGTSWIALFRDPAGNAIGLYREGMREGGDVNG